MLSKIGLIGNEETVIGYKLAGICNTEDSKNVIIINGDETKENLIEILEKLVSRKDIGLILISDFVSEKIKESIDSYKNKVPHIVIIPSRNIIN